MESKISISPLWGSILFCNLCIFPRGVKFSPCFFCTFKSQIYPKTWKYHCTVTICSKNHTFYFYVLDSWGSQIGKSNFYDSILEKYRVHIYFLSFIISYIVSQVRYINNEILNFCIWGQHYFANYAIFSWVQNSYPAFFYSYKSKLPKNVKIL